jgi:hypothetical protein
MVALARRRGWNTVAQLRERAAAAAGARAAPAGAEQWTCACGTRFRLTGAGRHQVFWLADAAEDEPVLGDRCPSCDQPLPSRAEAG